MSLTFSTKINKIPIVQEIEERISAQLKEVIGDNNIIGMLEFPLLVCERTVDQPNFAFEDSHRFFFHIPLMSSRGVEVWLYDGEMHVDIMPFSTPLEFHLGLCFLEEFRNYGATSIFCDADESTVGFDFLRKKYDPNFYSHWSRHLLRALMAKIEESVDDQQFMILRSVVRDFYFGPKTASILAVEPNEDARLAQLTEMMMYLQFFQFLPDCSDVAPSNQTLHWTGIKSARIEPDVRYFIGKEVDELHFDRGGKIHKVKCSVFLDQFALELEDYQMVDEFQFLLRVDEDDIEGIIDGGIARKQSPIPFIGRR